MKATDYIDILRSQDDPNHVEWPECFNWLEAGEKAAQFAMRLSDVLGSPVEVETGDKVQDANFHTQLWVPTAGGIEVRFSNFGDLVSVRPVEHLPNKFLARIVALLSDAGYVYIPADVLERRYDGPIPHIDSWYHRFFDWL